MLIIFNLKFLERKTVDIESSTVEIEERGVKLRLTVVDTPGFGDSINSKERLDFQKIESLNDLIILLVLKIIVINQ